MIRILWLIVCMLWLDVQANPGLGVPQWGPPEDVAGHQQAASGAAEVRGVPGIPTTYDRA